MWLGCEWRRGGGAARVPVQACMPGTDCLPRAFRRPVSAFIAVGFEHCVANMVFLPLAIFAGRFGGANQMDGQALLPPPPRPATTVAQPHPFAGVPGITWKAALLGNLLPVTLGNMFAGIVCVATLYSLAFGKLGQRVEAALAPAT